ncbi:hypothetical protein BX600DRAFT_433738 [Xylariales sp. PMI_506]|nr:hypothetical protein BX600DRAFT_433738 [Xylariales sp. PMI_506]
MSTQPEYSDDLNCTLQSISAANTESKLVQRLVEIQSSQVQQEKSIHFLQNLECLFFKIQVGEIDCVLTRAAKYTVLLESIIKDEYSAPMSMSPRILTDLLARDLKCLINGEIISNNPSRGNSTKVGAFTITEAIESLFFYGITCPFSDKNLAFNKDYRFSNVKLTEDGIETEGYLWELDESQAFSCECPRRNNHLKHLVEVLRDQDHIRLSDHIQDLISHNRTSSFSHWWQDAMVTNMEAAVADGKTLCPARRARDDSSGVALFIVEEMDECPSESGAVYGGFDDSDSTESSNADLSFVFTSFRAGKDDSNSSKAAKTRYEALDPWLMLFLLVISSEFCFPLADFTARAMIEIDIIQPQMLTPSTVAKSVPTASPVLFKDVKMAAETSLSYDGENGHQDTVKLLLATEWI